MPTISASLSFSKSFLGSCLFNVCKPRKMVQNVLYLAKNKCTLEILSTGLAGRQLKGVLV